MELYMLLLLPLVGIIVGLLAGLFGLGGGIVIVPALLIIFPILGLPPSTHVAIGTSLAAMFITLCGAVYSHIRQDSPTLLWNISRDFLPGIIFGVALGALVARYLPDSYLRIVFGVIVYLLAIRVLFVRKVIRVAGIANWLTKIAPTNNTNRWNLPPRPIVTMVGFFIAAISMLLGISGGIFTDTFLDVSAVPMEVATGISPIVGLPIVVFGTISYIIMGYHDAASLPAWSSGYVYWPGCIGITLTSVITAHYGVKLARYIPEYWLRLLFMVVLLVVGTKMIFFS